MISRESLAEVKEALVRRRDVIADHAFRDRDAAGHLEALKEVSMQLAEFSRSLAPVLPPRLAHFLERCSYDKALGFVEEASAADGGDH